MIFCCSRYHSHNPRPGTSEKTLKFPSYKKNAASSSVSSLSVKVAKTTHGEYPAMGMDESCKYMSWNIFNNIIFLFP